MMQVLREPATRTLGVWVCGRTFRSEGYKSLGDFCETPSHSLLPLLPTRCLSLFVSNIRLAMRLRAFSLGHAATFLDEVNRSEARITHHNTHGINRPVSASSTPQFGSRDVRDFTSMGAPGSRREVWFILQVRPNTKRDGIPR